MHGKILTGTASWMDPGYIADWYPPDLPASHRLRWYAEHFSLVEVNSTFYRAPEAPTVRKWCEQTPSGFIFDVKLHRLFSRHSTKIQFLPASVRDKVTLKKDRVELTPSLEKMMAKLFLKGIAPLEKTGKLGALLLQLSPSFGPRHHQLGELDHLVELFKGCKLAIELRNAGWVSPQNFGQTKHYFASRKLVFVMVDGPTDPHFMVLPSLDAVTNPQLAYLRAHGRNASGYVRGRTVAERFDYDYPENELNEIAGRALSAAEQAREVHIIYNNNKSDFAPRAAVGFQKILHEQHPETLPAELQSKESAYA